MAANPYRFLQASEAETPKGIFEWAKKLINDLSRRDTELGAASSGVPVGAAMLWHESEAPDGWLLADGSAHSVDTYPRLFLVYGYRYGGSGGTFNVPDYRSRMPMGAGDHVGLNATAGSTTTSLNEDNLPAHNHNVTDPGHTHAFSADEHTHTITDAGHTHNTTDPQHTHVFTGAAHNHGITDPGHAHAALVGAAINQVGTDTGSATAGDTASAGTGITINNATAGGTNAASATGLSINNAVTGIAVDDTTMTGTNSSATTGVQTEDTGGNSPFNVLNPVFGVNVIIKY